MKNIIIFIVAVSIGCMSSVAWKISFLQTLKKYTGGSLFLSQLTNLWYIVGWIFYLAFTFLWIYLLSKYEYSKIYPIFVGVCIVLSIILGFVFFKENTGMVYKIVGSSFIIFGAFLITRA